MQDRGTLVTAVVLMILALILTGHWIRSSTSWPAFIPAGTTPKSRSSLNTTKAKKPHIDLIDPRLVSTKVYFESRPYVGGRDIFSAGIKKVQIVSQPHPVREEKRSIQLTSLSPPVAELRFFGFVTAATYPRKIFLAKGDDVFVAVEGEVVDRRYKVTKINSDSVVVEDLLENREHTLPLQEG